MENKKVLLAIDDNPVQLRLYKEMLVPKFDLRAAKSASDAINFMNSNKVDLILLDIEMPNVSGFVFLEDIRRIPSYMDVPIIIVSGNSGNEFMEKARNSTAASVLSKPVDPNVLVEKIEEAFTAGN